MSRSSYRRCGACGDYHWTDNWPDNHVEPAPQRSHLPAPSVISDTMDPVQSQATGEIHDSKASLRAEYRREGVIEVGNDPARLKPKPRARTSRKAIKDTVEKAAARFNRGERVNPHKVKQA